MTELEQAQHHVTEGRRIVAEQRGASRLFQSARRDATEAERDLALFEDSLAIFEDHLRWLQKARS